MARRDEAARAGPVECPGSACPSRSRGLDRSESPSAAHLTASHRVDTPRVHRRKAVSGMGSLRGSPPSLPAQWKPKVWERGRERPQTFECCETEPVPSSARRLLSTETQRPWLKPSNVAAINESNCPPVPQLLSFLPGNKATAYEVVQQTPRWTCCRRGSGALKRHRWFQAKM